MCTVDLFNKWVKDVKMIEFYPLWKASTTDEYNMNVEGIVEEVAEEAVEEMAVEPMKISPPTSPSTFALYGYENFLQRVQYAKNRAISSDLAYLITADNLKEIYDYVLNQPSILKPGESLYLTQAQTGLPRAISIIHDINDEYKLIIETKSELWDRSKQNLTKIKGLEKSGKNSWRLDKEEELYFSLTMKIKSDKHYQEILKEVRISQMFNTETLNKYDLGQPYCKNGVWKVKLYAPKAIDNLTELLKYREHLSDHQIEILIRDLLIATKTLHDQDIVHQDIKPANVLVWGNAQSGYRLKLTDYGISEKQNDQNEYALAALGCHSPEIRMYHHAHQSPFHTFYEKENGFAEQMINEADWAHCEQYKAPHKANDMWALGIMIYVLLHGKEPTLPSAQPHIESNPLLQNLLTSRAQRADIHQVLALFEAMISHKPALCY